MVWVILGATDWRSALDALSHAMLAATIAVRVSDFRSA